MGCFGKSKSNIILHKGNTKQEPVSLTHTLIDQSFEVNSEVNMSYTCISIQNLIEISSPWVPSLDGDLGPRTSTRGRSRPLEPPGGIAPPPESPMVITSMTLVLSEYPS